MLLILCCAENNFPWRAGRLRMRQTRSLTCQHQQQWQDYPAPDPTRTEVCCRRCFRPRAKWRPAFCPENSRATVLETVVLRINSKLRRLTLEIVSRRLHASNVVKHANKTSWFTSFATTDARLPCWFGARTSRSRKYECSMSILNVQFKSAFSMSATATNEPRPKQDLLPNWTKTWR